MTSFCRTEKLDDKYSVISIEGIDVLYSHELNMIRLYDIMNKYEKRPIDWIRNASTQKIIQRYPELIRKLNGNVIQGYFIDISLLPMVLMWIDPVIGYNYMNGLNIHDKSTDGYIYIIQKPKHFNTNIYKIGRTYNIFRRYDKDVKIISLKYVKDMYTAEYKLIKAFNELYDSVKGKEYFEVNNYGDMINIFNSID